MDPSYQSTEQVDVSAIHAGDVWDDPAIGAYLAQSHQAEEERIEAELARINDQLAARETLHDELMIELRWQVETYERELDRVATPYTATTEERDRMTARLRDIHEQMRDERRQHWQDCQQLERERRELRRERAALNDEDLSQLL